MAILNPSYLYPPPTLPPPQTTTPNYNIAPNPAVELQLGSRKVWYGERDLPARLPETGEGAQRMG